MNSNSMFGGGGRTMQGNAATIDVDAIPFDLTPQKRRPVVMVCMATVETLRDGRVKVMPHHHGPVWKWFTVRRPTFAHGPRGQGDTARTPSGAPGRDTGERGASGRPVG